jgi:hypothetical protein
MPDTPRTGIFISHAHVDADLARLLADLLESSLSLPAHRITCTSHEEHGLVSGEPLRRQLQERLNSAAVLVLLSTPNSEGKDWVEYEGAYADGQGVPLHVLVPSDVYRGTIPEPFRDKVAVILTNVTQVLAFIEQVAAQLSTVPRVSMNLPLLSRLVHHAHGHALEHYQQAIAAERDRCAESIGSEKLRCEQALRQDRRLWGRLLLAVAGVAAIGVVYLDRNFDTQLSASSSICDGRLTAQTRTLNEAHQAALKRFPLSGRLVVGSTPLSNAKLEVYRNIDGDEKPIATDSTDVTGAFAFAEGELTIDPREQVDFVVRVAADRVLLKKASPLDARLNISFE